MEPSSQWASVKVSGFHLSESSCRSQKDTDVGSFLSVRMWAA